MKDYMDALKKEIYLREKNEAKLQEKYLEIPEKRMKTESNSAESEMSTYDTYMGST